MSTSFCCVFWSHNNLLFVVNSDDVRVMWQLIIDCDCVSHLLRSTNKKMWQLQCKLQLEAVHLNCDSRAKCKVTQPIHCHFIVCWYITLHSDLDLWPWSCPWIFDLEHLWYTACALVKLLSAIEQSVAESLWFQYLTEWSLTHVTCCAQLWDNFRQSWTWSAYLFLTYSIYLLLLRCVMLWPWPWPLTHWPQFVVHCVSHGQSLCEIWAKSNNPRLTYR